jgi:tetratricopeptide (TPR) repeat protein
MFKANTLALSIFTAFALGGCASLGELQSKFSSSVATAESRRTEMTAQQLCQLAKEYRVQQRSALAVIAYLEALKRDSALVDAHNGLGIIYSEQGRYDEAVSEFNAAIEQQPTAGYLHNNLGYALLLEGLNQEALSALETAVRLEPDNEKAAFNLQFAQVRLGMSLQVHPQTSAETRRSSEQGLPAASPQPNTGNMVLVSVAPNIYELKEREETTPLQPPMVEQELRAAEPVRKARNFQVEVANGNGTKGMARHVAGILDRRGIHANRITNHVTFRQATTQIQYRHGYQAQAVALRDAFPAQIKAVPNSALRKDIHVRVLLGQDAAQFAQYPRDAYTIADAVHAAPGPVRMPR